MKENKKINLRERQRYVPASVKVIEVAVQRAILSSSNQNLNDYDGNSPWSPSY